MEVFLPMSSWFWWDLSSECEKYFGGEKLGVDERGEIFKGMLSFMLVGLRSNSHFIINCVSEREVNRYFVLNNLKECLDELNFNVRGAVSETTLVMCLRTGNCFHTKEMIHLIFISHSIVTEYIFSTSSFIWWRAFATISSITKDFYFHLMILHSLMTGFVFLLAKLDCKFFVALTRRISFYSLRLVLSSYP